MRKRFIKWLNEKVIWIRWGIQTALVILSIIIGMIYGWGLVPKRWSVVIACYIIANALIPFIAHLNYQLAKKMGWEVPVGSHIHKNPPKGIKRRKKVDINAIAEESPLDDRISNEYRTSHLVGKFPGKNMGD